MSPLSIILQVTNHFLLKKNSCQFLVSDEGKLHVSSTVLLLFYFAENSRGCPSIEQVYSWKYGIARTCYVRHTRGSSFRP